MSTSVLPQLLEVNAELLAQSSSLEAQLNELQEKRKGIQTVIAMFESGSSPEATQIAAAVVTPSPAKKVAKRSPKAKATKTTTAKAKTTKAKATKTTAAKAKTTKAKTTKTTAAKAKTTKAKATKTTAAKATAAKVKATKAKVTRGRPAKAKATASVASSKRSGRTANWQRFVQENYSKAPLPDVIVGILQAQPSNVFKIADVMTAVFKEDMPKNHFLKARNRVSNILSAGARDGHWYRGRGGTYSASEKAIKTAG